MGDYGSGGGEVGRMITCHCKDPGSISEWVQAETFIFEHFPGMKNIFTSKFGNLKL